MLPFYDPFLVFEQLFNSNKGLINEGLNGLTLVKIPDAKSCSIVYAIV